jgi:hypothetical protein
MDLHFDGIEELANLVPKVTPRQNYWHMPTGLLAQ